MSEQNRSDSWFVNRGRARVIMLDAQIVPILLLTGSATTCAFVMFLAPSTMTKMLFGNASSNTSSILIARHWGLLIFLVGALLIYAAYHQEIRIPTLVIAIVEKTTFALGVFISPLRRSRTAFVVALADASMAIVYAVYLIGLQCRQESS
jgi:hypothetical protein